MSNNTTTANAVDASPEQLASYRKGIGLSRDDLWRLCGRQVQTSQSITLLFQFSKITRASAKTLSAFLRHGQSVFTSVVARQAAQVVGIGGGQIEREEARELAEIGNGNRTGSVVSSR